MTLALIVVDVQNDFCEGGSLAVAGGAAVATGIGALTGSSRFGGGSHYDLVVATRDHHIDPGAHFSTTPDYVDSWPPHCVVGTAGAQFHPNFETTAVSAVFSKGEYSAAYSGFEGASDNGTSLADYLRGRGVTDVHLVGIATDYCVRATALDAMASGFATTVLLAHCAAVAPVNTDAVVNELRAAGVAVAGDRSST